MEIKKKLHENGLLNNIFLDNQKPYYYNYFTVELLSDYSQGDFEIVSSCYKKEKDQSGYIKYIYTNLDLKFEYSKNNGPWTELLKSTFGNNKYYTFPDGNAGDKLCLRCNVNEVLAASELEGDWFYDIYIFGNKTYLPDLDESIELLYYNLSGNILSLLYGNQFKYNNSLVLKRNIEDEGTEGTAVATITCRFDYFCESSSILSAENLILSADNLPDLAYNHFFESSSLQNAPTLLDRTHLGCPYNRIFSNCTNLEGNIYIPISSSKSTSSEGDTMLFGENFSPKYNATIDLSNSDDFNSLFPRYLYDLSQSVQGGEQELLNLLQHYKFIIPDEFELPVNITVYESKYDIYSKAYESKPYVIKKISRKYKYFDNVYSTSAIVDMLLGTQGNSEEGNIGLISCWTSHKYPSGEDDTWTDEHPSGDAHLGYGSGYKDIDARLVLNKPKEDFQYFVEIYENDDTTKVGDFFIEDDLTFFRYIVSRLLSSYHYDFYNSMLTDPESREAIINAYNTTFDYLKTDNGIISKTTSLLETPLTFITNNTCEFIWDLEYKNTSLGLQYEGVSQRLKNILLYSFDKINWKPYQGTIIVPKHTEISWKMAYDIRELSVKDEDNNLISLKDLGPNFRLYVNSERELWCDSSIYNELRNYGSEYNTGYFDVYGNIMSLFADTNIFKDIYEIPWKNCFKETFKNTKIISAKNLILPAIYLKDSCYESMFYNCMTLNAAPDILPSKNPWMKNNIDDKNLYHEINIYDLKVYHYNDTYTYTRATSEDGNRDTDIIMDAHLYSSTGVPILYDYELYTNEKNIVHFFAKDPLNHYKNLKDNNGNLYFDPDINIGNNSGLPYRTYAIEVYYKTGNTYNLLQGIKDNEWWFNENSPTNLTIQDLYYKDTNNNYINILSSESLNRCYANMFSGCQALLYPPKINLTSTGLHYYSVYNSYFSLRVCCEEMMSGMFENAGLIKGDDCHVLATNGIGDNFNSMYNKCYNLSSITVYTRGCYDLSGKHNGEFDNFIGSNVQTAYCFKSLLFDLIFSGKQINFLNEEPEVIFEPPKFDPIISLYDSYGNSKYNVELTGWNDFGNEDSLITMKDIASKINYTWDYFIEKYKPKIIKYKMDHTTYEVPIIIGQSGNAVIAQGMGSDPGKSAVLYYNNSKVNSHDMVNCIPGQSSTSNYELDYQFRNPIKVTTIGWDGTWTTETEERTTIGWSYSFNGDGGSGGGFLPILPSS